MPSREDLYKLHARMPSHKDLYNYHARSASQPCSPAPTALGTVIDVSASMEFCWIQPDIAPAAVFCYDAKMHRVVEASRVEYMIKKPAALSKYRYDVVTIVAHMHSPSFEEQIHFRRAHAAILTTSSPQLQDLEARSALLAQQRYERELARKYQPSQAARAAQAVHPTQESRYTVPQYAESEYAQSGYLQPEESMQPTLLSLPSNTVQENELLQRTSSLQPPTYSIPPILPLQPSEIAQTYLAPPNDGRTLQPQCTIRHLLEGSMPDERSAEEWPRTNGKRHQWHNRNKSEKFAQP